VIRILDKSAIYFRKSKQLENQMATTARNRFFNLREPRLFIAKMKKNPLALSTETSQHSQKYFEKVVNEGYNRI